MVLVAGGIGVMDAVAVVVSEAGGPLAPPQPIRMHSDAASRAAVHRDSFSVADQGIVFLPNASPTSVSTTPSHVMSVIAETVRPSWCGGLSRRFACRAGDPIHLEDSGARVLFIDGATAAQADALAIHLPRIKEMFYLDGDATPSGMRSRRACDSTGHEQPHPVGRAMMYLIAISRGEPPSGGRSPEGC